MKSAHLSYHRSFPDSPISFWAGARRYGWIRQTTKSGQSKKPRCVRHPFRTQRPLWCRLWVHFDAVDLVFALPPELDQFLDVMSRNPLPSGYSLVPHCPVGRPNQHWLSRLPGRAKPWKFRQAVCRHLRDLPEARRFRAFYAANPPKFEFEGYFDSDWAANSTRPWTAGKRPV